VRAGAAGRLAEGVGLGGLQLRRGPVTKGRPARLLTFDTRTIDVDAHPNRSSRRQMLGGQQQHRTTATAQIQGPFIPLQLKLVEGLPTSIPHRFHISPSSGCD
jgi:hypothetical protein